MDERLELKTSVWKLVKDERKPIFLGLAFGATVSAIFPLIKSAFQAGNRWIWDPLLVDGNALPMVIISIAGLAFFLWPGPVFLQWLKSYSQGINRGSFVVPALTVFFTLGLRYWLPLRWWCISIPVISAVAFLILYLPYRRSQTLELNDDRSDDERRSLGDAWPERRKLAETIADHILKEGKATYAVYGGFGAGKSSMLNFISEALRGDPNRRVVIVRFNGWLPGSRDNFADQLLSDIATQCSREYYIPQFRQTTARVAKTLTTTVPHLGWLSEWVPKETQQDAIDSLSKVLGRLPGRLIVLVDEIDRMRKEELFCPAEVNPGIHFPSACEFRLRP